MLSLPVGVSAPPQPLAAKVASAPSGHSCGHVHWGGGVKNLCHPTRISARKRRGAEMQDSSHMLIYLGASRKVSL